MNSDIKKESFKLLGVSNSESGSDIPEFALPKRKVKIKKKFRTTSMNSRSNGLRPMRGCSAVFVFKILGVLVVAISLGVTVWLAVTLHIKVDELRKQYIQVEKSNEGMPATFHNIHSEISDLEKNYTVLKEEFHELNRILEKVSKEMVQLRATTEDLHDRLAAAPQLENFPKDFESLKKSFANMGSKITNAEEQLKQVDNKMSTNDVEEKQLQAQLQSLQKKFDQFLVDQHAVPVQSSPLVTDIEIKKLEDIIYNMNDSIWEKLQWSINDLHEHHIKITDDHSSLQNLTNRVDNLAASPPDSDAVIQKVVDTIQLQLKLLVNDTVISLIGSSLHTDLLNMGDINGTIPLSSLLHYVQTLTRLYLSLLVNSQLMPSAEFQNFNDTLNLNFTKIIEDTVTDMIASFILEEDQIIKNMNYTILQLETSCQLLEGSTKHIAQRLDGLQARVDQLDVPVSPTDSSATNDEPAKSISPAMPNLTLKVQTTTPSLPVATTAAVLTSPASTKSDVPLPDSGEHNITAVPVGIPSLPTLSGNQTLTDVSNATSLASSGASTPGHIRKPSHTGGSLPDDAEPSIH